MTSSIQTNGPVTLSEEQIKQLLAKLSNMRHDVTGRLSNITAAAELIRARPAKLEERMVILLEQPHLTGRGMHRQVFPGFGVGLARGAQVGRCSTPLAHGTV